MRQRSRSGVSVLVIGCAILASGCKEETDGPRNLPKTGTSSTGGVGGSGGAGGSGAGQVGGGGMGGAGGDVPQGTGKECVEPCSSADDCAMGTLGPESYSCDEGRCIWLGCLSDAECEAQESGSLCRDFYGTPTCYPSCETVNDCTGLDPTQGDDNYLCDDGACHYLGCTSDNECGQLIPGSVCVQKGPANVPDCVTPCTSANQCALLLEGENPFDEDNWICDIACIYGGCIDDGECQAFLGPTYECL